MDTQVHCVHWKKGDESKVKEQSQVSCFLEWCMITQVLHGGTSSSCFLIEVNQAGWSSSSSSSSSSSWRRWFTRSSWSNRNDRSDSGYGNFGSDHFGRCISGRIWMRARFLRVHSGQRRNFSVFVVTFIPSKIIDTDLFYILFYILRLTSVVDNQYR